ncbi:hypothetical protein O6H91_02G099900 [Diphasiastrum complanatum]|uniref:Uncharacterized protein n=1 Tax=Diphasiastrum complanatum TaxID=34168 RepID=A0ACC2EIT3_DIPCM|nr:hypothetical protein O6H91_02G099900 [Diphasiastrum complanatum]
MELLQLKEMWAEEAGLSLAPPSSMDLYVSCSSSISSNPGYNGYENDKPSPVPSEIDGERKRKRLLHMWNSNASDRERTAREVHSSGMVTVAPKHDIELILCSPLPLGWEQCLDMQTGEMYYVNSSTHTKTREDPRKHCPDLSQPTQWPYDVQDWAINYKAPTALSDALESAQLDLSLNLAFKRTSHEQLNNESTADLARNSGNLQSLATLYTTRAVAGLDHSDDMVAVPCRNCLMFVMLPRASPQCPKCGTSYFPAENKNNY